MKNNNDSDKKYKIFSFFSGAGFLDLGFESAGFNIVFSNEISPDFAYANRYSRANMGLDCPKYGLMENDIKLFLEDNKKLSDLIDMITNEKDNDNIVGFIGGPPCPDFSVAGKNRGESGKNGILSKIYIDLICKCSPDFFFFENVKGLLKTVKHREFFYKIVSYAEENGYITVNRLVNSLEYGVPQDRDRIFLIGIKKDIIKQNINKFDWGINKSAKEIKSLPWPGTSPLCHQPIDPPKGIDENLTAQRWFEKNDVINHPNAHDFFKPRAIMKKMLIIEEGDDSRKSTKRLHRWRYSPTVAYGNNEVHLHPYFNRRLSVAEALALQSLPSGFYLPPDMTLTSKFKTIGNGVPYLMAKGVASSLISFLDGNIL